MERRRQPTRGLDLWEILLEILMWPVLQPALARGEPDGELLRRCFGFVKDIYDESSQHRSGAVYFQIMESLPDDRLYFKSAIPYLRGPVREGVSSMLKYYEVEGCGDGLPPL
ncbi:hypothetical protein ACFXJO_18120 [Streptomyces lavendulae]|uniref:hypothetical protein n=1 Tax=Streptomyces lavendulae TaxID=1914 RepID=UPI0036A69EDC